MYDAVLNRLKAMGCVPTDDDAPAVQYAIDRAEQWIKNNINRPEVPDGLRFIWIDMAAGLFLADLKAAGQLTGPAFDFTAPAKTIAEGDTSVTFAVDTELSPEAQFDKRLESMINPPQDQLAAYRRLKW